MGSEPTEVRELAFQFSNLQISIRVAVTPVGGTQSSTTPASTAPAIDLSALEVEPTQPGGFPVPESLERAALAATSPEELQALPLGFLQHLQSRLHGSDSTWTPAARIGRAFRAGLAARRRLAGRYTTERSLTTPFRNTVYVILRSPDYPEGAWSLDYDKFFAACGGNRHHDFAPETICHSFATRTEAEAYLEGAGKGWPRQLR